MKRKNGFTLIELLVTIAIALSIMGLAVLSTIAISNRRKKQAYEEVKQQVMTAAKQYFDSNAYLFDSLDSAHYGVITVGTLVQNDYLNKTTNPLTGKPLNDCDQVIVQKVNKIYKLKYNEYKEGNKCVNEVIITEDGAPTIKLTPYKIGDSNHSMLTASSNTGYYNKNDLGGDGHLGIYVDHTGASLEVRDGFVGEYTKVTTNSTYEDKNAYYEDTIIKTTCYKSINGSKSTESCVDYGVDTVAPTFEAKAYQRPEVDTPFSTSLNTLENSSWYKGYAYTRASDQFDATSGVASTVHTTTGVTTNVQNQSGANWGVAAEGKSKITYKVCDKANNCTSKSLNVWLDRTAPTFVVKGYKRPEVNTPFSTDLKELKNEEWYSGWAYTRAEGQTDALSGYASTVHTTTGVTTNVTNEAGTSWGVAAEGKSKITYKVCDKATNCASKSINVYLDRTAPKVQFKIVHVKTNDATTAKEKYNDAGTLLDSKTIQGTGNTMDGYSWFNGNSSSSQYNQYGFYLYGEDIDDDVSKVVSYWNKSALDWDSAQTTEYNWDSSKKSYGNCSGCTKTYKKENDYYNNTWIASVGAAGARKLRFFFYDEADNVTAVAISLNIDRTKPTPSITEGYNAKCGNSSSNSGYSKGTTVTGTCTDAISGTGKNSSGKYVFKSNISKTLNTLGTNINITDGCKDIAGNVAVASRKVCEYSSDSSCGSECSDYTYSCPSVLYKLSGTSCNKFYISQEVCLSQSSCHVCAHRSGDSCDGVKCWVCPADVVNATSSCTSYSHKQCWHY